MSWKKPRFFFAFKGFLNVYAETLVPWSALLIPEMGDGQPQIVGSREIGFKIAAYAFFAVRFVRMQFLVLVAFSQWVVEFFRHFCSRFYPMFRSFFELILEFYCLVVTGSLLCGHFLLHMTVVF